MGKDGKVIKEHLMQKGLSVNSSIRPASSFSFFPVSTYDLYIASATHAEGQIKNKSLNDGPVCIIIFFLITFKSQHIQTQSSNVCFPS